MKYMGSKNRYAKYILPIILENRTEGQWYVEPFVGGANMIDKVDGNRIGADIHPHLIALLNAVQNGWTPPDIVTETEYARLKSNQESNIDALTGFAGFCLSFGAKWFGGYRRDKKGSAGCIQNMKTQTRRSKESLLKQTSNLKDIKFYQCAYDALYIPPKSIIYCDPPYAGTTKYKTGAFDHAAFWRWCDEKVEEGHTVFVSEYSAPSHWTCIWEKETSSSLVVSGEKKKSIEKLFTRVKE